MESDDELRTIGEMARASGLTISALRFYDGAGVLSPAFVDPHNGYRRYAAGQVPAARLVAGLRRVGMPLPQITAMLDRRDDRPGMHALLDAHLRRLEDGLTDARRELSRIHRMIDGDLDLVEDLMTDLTVPAGGLRAALAAVRYAAGNDPELPTLGGVFVELLDGALRLVTTDRYRMAIADVPLTDLTGPDVGVVAPLPLVDALVPLLAAGDPVRMSLSASEIRFAVGGHGLSGLPLPGEFPDYRRALAARAGEPLRVSVDAAALRRDVAAAPTVLHENAPVLVLTVGADGAIEAGSPDRPHRIAVNREFLLAALDAGGPGQLVLELDGPIMPLALRGPDSFAVVMPVRL
ncbi:MULTISPECIES: DNA polymerase III subunit beta family protein [Catenuloplanes]|uniref:DNA-binding transcriptional MerR regulator n=1 Tax=Catenuloplanes niger TaxID=587534 RepID=A0AAE3ZPP1_9ACTN|nr:MerR family DNA-binding transcriptional regulator [Catenuloplanes niger]MDR7323779.1 DNA-binding transcriptional MerR regulator [Catenuloplanes niger]